MEEGEILSAYRVWTAEDYWSSRRRIDYHATAARMQRNSSTVMRVWKQWTDEHRAPRKTNSGWRKVTSARDDQHLLQMAVYDHTASSRQLSVRWSTVTGVVMSTPSIYRRLLNHGLCAMVPLYMMPLTANHRRLCLQWTHEHRAWHVDWPQVVFSGVYVQISNLIS